ncbi:MAG: quinolinate synthase NadA [Chloroflexi bacterium]|nr:quinolinate synthase NadA [Chloroflexota bacterium]MDA1240171.1 quinolinate synthase NadA [Chloroflexota bacterium]
MAPTNPITLTAERYPIAQLQCETDTGIETIPLSQEVAFGSWQPDIPAAYMDLGSDELTRRIHAARATLGDRVVILGHHYQREDIIAFADERGDSFQLAQYAANRGESEYIVFCGVHFMAEAADVLRAPHQQVILPNMAAGCSMADMASEPDVHRAWAELKEFYGSTDDIIPVTYMNSAASLKAFCGANGGVVCTSSNATKVLDWAFERGKRVFFFPDQHLGRNTGHAMGITLDEMVLWNWRTPAGNLGGATPEALERARVILWQGHCSVHQRFTVQQIEQARVANPDVKIVVHPECRYDVVQAADANGSTGYIVKYIQDAPAGSVIGVGTEINLVSRLAKEHPDKTIFCLDPVVCPCSTMYRVHPAYLAWVMEELVAGRVVNRLEVPEHHRRDAKVALDRMLALK